jgi:hypothetical protein
VVPQVDPKTAVVGMAVTVTLVFADESHREAWLLEQGIVPACSLPPKNGQNEYVMPADYEERRDIARRIDYERRRENTDLSYVVGPIRVPHSQSGRHPGSIRG